MSERRAVGVLGGMGPAATWDFCERVRRATGASRDQDHLHLIVDSDPSLPDRNAAVAGEGPSPGPRLGEMAAGLERAGAQLLVMPCNAAHAFLGDVRAASRLPFLNMVELTVEAALARRPGLRTAAVLATTGCLDAELYQRAFAARGAHAAVPRGARRDELMDLVYRVKRGDDPATLREAARALAERFVADGAELIVAACSEIPLVLDDADLEAPLLASSEALARATVAVARGDRPLPGPA